VTNPQLLNDMKKREIVRDRNAYVGIVGRQQYGGGGKKNMVEILISATTKGGRRIHTYGDRKYCKINGGQTAERSRRLGKNCYG